MKGIFKSRIIENEEELDVLKIYLLKLLSLKFKYFTCSLCANLINYGAVRSRATIMCKNSSNRDSFVLKGHWV